MLASIEIFDWVVLKFNAAQSYVLIAPLFGVLLFEAFPEEFLFRGYIFGNFNLKLARWKASLTAILLFCLFPITLVAKSSLLNMEANLGGTSNIRLEYLITLILIGSMMQYLRMLTRSVWTSVRFHLFFVFQNWLLGPQSNEYDSNY
jgi:hypothetical protein